MSETTSAQERTKATVARIARSIVDRAERQGWKGKKADSLALECAVGALAGVIATCGEDSTEANAASMFAFIVSTRGMAYAKERAAPAKPAAADDAP